MATIREEAIALQKQGLVLITQKGKSANTWDIKGPIRIKIIDDMQEKRET